MTHLGEEDLVLHHYGESPAAPAVEAHLASCERCREQLDALRADLAVLEADPVPERGPSYGAEVWQRIRPQLGPAAPARRLAFAPRRLAWGAALAASLVFAFLLGRHLPRPGTGAAPTPGAVRERILLVAVGDHLERSHMVLIELVNAGGDGPVDITSEQQSAGQLVAASRLYRQAAARSGEPGVANLLEELERVLVEVANGPSQLTTGQLEEIQRRIEGQGLIFKMRVLGSQVREREKETARGSGGRVS